MRTIRAALLLVLFGIPAYAQYSAVTPIAVDGNLTLVAGGSSQTFATARVQTVVCYLSNGITAADQGGIAAPESIWVNPTGGAASTSPGGSSVEIPAGTMQPLIAQTTAITWTAPTTGHKISGFCE